MFYHIIHIQNCTTITSSINFYTNIGIEISFNTLPPTTELSYFQKRNIIRAVPKDLVYYFGSSILSVSKSLMSQSFVDILYLTIFN